MRKLWEQMTGRPVKPSVRRKRLTHEQKDARYIVNRMHKGLEWDLDKRAHARAEQRNRKAAESEAFQLLRKLGMV